VKWLWCLIVGQTTLLVGLAGTVGHDPAVLAWTTGLGGAVFVVPDLVHVFRGTEDSPSRARILGRMTRAFHLCLAAWGVLCGLYFLGVPGSWLRPLHPALLAATGAVILLGNGASFRAALRSRAGAG